MARALDAEFFSENFDGGTLGLFNAQVDSGSSLITFPHYSELARNGTAPWSGDRAMKCTPSGSATSYLHGTAAGNIFTVIDANETFYFWFPICVQADFTLTASDVLPVFQLKSGTTTTEVEFGIQRTAGGDYQFYAGETGATNTITFTRNNKVWHQIELTVHLDAGGGNDGTLDFYVDGNPVGAQITALDQAVITDGWLGISSEGETLDSASGSFLIDQMVMTSDNRIYPQERFPTTKYIHQNEVAFVGPCILDSIHFTSTTQLQQCIITDTDDSISTGRGARAPRMILGGLTAKEVVPGFQSPIKFERGVRLAFVDDAGTATATVPFEAVVTVNGGSPVMSHANYVDRGLKRKNQYAK